MAHGRYKKEAVPENGVAYTIDSRGGGPIYAYTYTQLSHLERNHSSDTPLPLLPVSKQILRENWQVRGYNMFTRFTSRGADCAIVLVHVRSACRSDVRTYVRRRATTSDIARARMRNYHSLTGKHPRALFHNSQYLHTYTYTWALTWDRKRILSYGSHPCKIPGRLPGILRYVRLLFWFSEYRHHLLHFVAKFRRCHSIENPSSLLIVQLLGPLATRKPPGSYPPARNQVGAANHVVIILWYMMGTNFVDVKASVCALVGTKRWQTSV